MSRLSNPSAHGTELKKSLKHSGEYLACTLGQLLLRLLCLAPLFYAAYSGGFPGAPQAHASGAALLSCVPLYILLVLPLRYRVGGRLSGWLNAQGPDTDPANYPVWLGQGVVRLLKALPLLLPLIAYLGAFYYYMNFADFPSFFLMIRSVGGLIGGDYVHGLALLLLLLTLCLLLAYIGWRRMMVFFYLPIRPLPQDGERRRALKGRGLGKVTFINMLIVLPPLAISVFLLASSLITRMTGDIQFDLMILLPAITAFDFPREDLIRVGLVMLVLYLPFVLWRKAALAAAIHGAGKGR